MLDEKLQLFIVSQNPLTLLLVRNNLPYIRPVI